MSTIQSFKKMNKFANKNRAGLNVAMVVLAIAAMSIVRVAPDSFFSSVVSVAVAVVIGVILFRVMVKVGMKK